MNILTWSHGTLTLHWGATLVLLALLAAIAGIKDVRR